MALETHPPDITHIIQLSVAPAFVLTAIASLINALNSRLGRAVDRRRTLEGHLAEFWGVEADSVRDELAAINRRIRCVYLAILFAVLSALFICLLIAGAFMTAFVAADLARPVAVLFVLAMLALVLCLVYFLREVFIAVSAPRHIPGAEQNA